MSSDTLEHTTGQVDSAQNGEDRTESEENREGDDSRADLAAQAELLAEENRRLRSEYVRSRQTSHRRTALGLFAVGLVAVVGGLALPASRTVLFALGGTGLFAGVLTYYLTPEQFVAAETGERVYAAFAGLGGELVGELGLRDDRVYVPARGTDPEFVGVRLFVPQRSDYAVPDAEHLESLFVVTDDERERGVSVPPTGGALYREFESSMTGRVPERPADLASQLADGLVDGFELVESARADADPGGRVAVEVSGSVYGTPDRFDHPVASFVAVGLADTLETAVTAEVRTDDEEVDCVVVCEWEPEEVKET